MDRRGGVERLFRFGAKEVDCAQDDSSQDYGPKNQCAQDQRGEEARSEPREIVGRGCEPLVDRAFHSRREEAAPIRCPPFDHALTQ